jgi:transcriptional regulator with XRE-family HTH domain
MTGQQMKSIREDLDLTVRQACEAMGLSPASERKWRRWESDREIIPSGIANDWQGLATQHGL